METICLPSRNASCECATRSAHWNEPHDRGAEQPTLDQADRLDPRLAPSLECPGFHDTHVRDSSRKRRNRGNGMTMPGRDPPRLASRPGAMAIRPAASRFCSDPRSRRPRVSPV